MEMQTTINEIFRTLGKIEGRLDAMQNVPDRVAKLELWQSWLKGGWATLSVACIYLFRGSYNK